MKKTLFHSLPPLRTLRMLHTLVPHRGWQEEGTLRFLLEIPCSGGLVKTADRMPAPSVVPQSRGNEERLTQEAS